MEFLKVVTDRQLWAVVVLSLVILITVLPLVTYLSYKFFLVIAKSAKKLLKELLLVDDDGLKDSYFGNLSVGLLLIGVSLSSNLIWTFFTNDLFVLLGDESLNVDTTAISGKVSGALMSFYYSAIMYLKAANLRKK